MLSKTINLRQDLFLLSMHAADADNELNNEDRKKLYSDSRLEPDSSVVTPLEQVIASQLSRTLDEIIRLRFGIGKKRDYTLDEIGEEFDLSRERIRQILKVALNKLRNPISTEKLQDFIASN